jgi:hypothetical protein
MFSISLQEIFIVLITGIGFVFYHLYLFFRVRRAPLKTAIGITYHARCR